MWCTIVVNRGLTTRVKGEQTVCTICTVQNLWWKEVWVRSETGEVTSSTYWVRTAVSHTQELLEDVLSDCKARGSWMFLFGYRVHCIWFTVVDSLFECTDWSEVHAGFFREGTWDKMAYLGFFVSALALRMLESRIGEGGWVFDPELVYSNIGIFKEIVDDYFYMLRNS